MHFLMAVSAKQEVSCSVNTPARCSAEVLRKSRVFPNAGSGFLAPIVTVIKTQQLQTVEMW